MSNRKNTSLTQKIYGFLRELARDRRGVTAIEYGLIASIMAAACVVGLATAGPTLASVFQTVSNSLQTVLLAAVS
ncbi:MAG: Flp family type IVb pilin [Rhodospirillales bacterium]|nr:Flp family type IVb pilin [Rhodospirillales bacterium]